MSLHTRYAHFTTALADRATKSCSTDNGATWQFLSVIDEGPSAYSALVVLNNGSVAILYERAPPPPKLVFVPTAISFTVVWSPAGTADGPKA